MIARLLKNPILIAPAAVLFVLLGWAAYGALSERRLQSELDAAARDMASGNSTSARDRLARLALAWPGRAEVLFSLGESELACGRVEQAISAWSQIPQKLAAVAEARPLLQHARLALQAARFSESEPHPGKTLSGKKARSGRERALPPAAPGSSSSRGRIEEARRLIEDRWRANRTPLDARRAGRSASRPHRTRPRDHAARWKPRSSWRQQTHSTRTTTGSGLLAPNSGFEDRPGLEEASRWLDATTVRRGDDPAVWRARLEWARAAGRPRSSPRRDDALERRRLERRRNRRAPRWIARSKGDTTDEKHALEQLLAANPGDLAALERLAELNFREGNQAEGHRLRSRKSELDAKLDHYHRLFRDGRLESSGPEMASLAAELGRDFEAHAFLSLAGLNERRKLAGSGKLERLRPPPAARSGSSESLAALFARELQRPAPPETGTPASTLRFEDDSGSSGLTGFVLDNGATASHQLPEVFCGGAGLIDYDSDGFLDVYLIQGGRFPPAAADQKNGDRLFRNRRDGTFDDVSRPSGLSAMTGGYGHGISVGDYDNDGHPDIFLTRWRAYALYRLRGDGTFEDATERAGLAGSRDWPTSSAFADLDNDGDLDLYVRHYGVWDERNPLLCKDPSGRVNISCDPRLIAPLTEPRLP